MDELSIWNFETWLVQNKGCLQDKILAMTTEEYEKYKEVLQAWREKMEVKHSVFDFLRCLGE